MLAACDGGDGATLTVDLRTDLGPGTEFSIVQTRLSAVPFGDAVEVERGERAASLSDDFLAGLRVASFEGVSDGTRYLEVALVDASGSVVASRDVVAVVSGDSAVTVTIARSCQDVSCPGAGDPERLSACQGGFCVDPRCTDQTPEFCGEGLCGGAEDCPASSGCLRSLCTAGACLSEPDDSACAATQTCTPMGSCMDMATDAGPPPPPPPPPPVDAGPPDAGLPPLSDNFCPDDPLLRRDAAIFIVKIMHGVGFVPPAATGTFTDVPTATYYAPYVEQLARDGVTNGCGTNLFCPGDPLTREQAAIFFVRADRGVGYTPPPATGLFTDVAANFFAPYIEQLARDGITNGCTSSTVFCPADPLLRSQSAVWTLRVVHGSGYTPPAASGFFDDVGTTHRWADWIDQLARQGFTNGCSR